jgi:large subunit ribosomal protein L5
VKLFNNMTKNITENKPRLEGIYKREIMPKLMESNHYKNVMEIPKLTKIVVNSSVKDAGINQAQIESTVNEIYLITGQKPVVTKAKKSIAGFKIRAGMSLGAKVTLRGKIMYEFLDRLVNVALPRVRDFKGFSSKQFDNKGNFSIGLKEQLVFPEINYDKVEKIRGMNITFVTTAKNSSEAKMLFEEFNIPFIQ